MSGRHAAIVAATGDTAEEFAVVFADLAAARWADVARRAGDDVDLDELDARLSDAVHRIGDIRGLIHAQAHT
jgi:hypothetical protein